MRKRVKAKAAILILCAALLSLPTAPLAPSATAEEKAAEGTAEPSAENPKTKTEAVLPSAVRALIKRSGIPPQNVGLAVRRIGAGRPLIWHEAERRFNPASVAKVATAFAALDVLGPDHRWKTRFARSGKIRDGVLEGDLHFIGGGDPRLTAERFLFMLSDLRARGLREIRGALVVDDSHFSAPPHDPGAFDGKRHKPYNAGPGGAAVNLKTHRVVIYPDGKKIGARLEPPSAHVEVKNNLRPGRGRCRNWRRNARDSLRDDGARAVLTLKGVFPPRCGEQSFYASVLSHASYAAGVFGAMWNQLGGEWSGEWRRGKTPEGATVMAEHESPPLSEAVKMMNKHSSNLIARNIFLSLPDAAPRTLERARMVLDSSLESAGAGGSFIENGSGLSREARMTPAQLARILESAWAGPMRAEMASSLPIAGLDGTMKRRLRNHGLAGMGRFKTGSLRGVKSIAGYARDARGREFVFVCLIKWGNGAAARQLQDSLLKWAHGAE